MRNRNTCKRFCAIMIILGLILCGGQLAYAHNPALEQGKTTAQNNPTSANLQMLITLFKQDINEHITKGENDEAEKSKNDMLDTTLEVAKAAQFLSLTEITKEHFENEVICWKQLVELYEDKEAAKDFEANAAMARANLANIIADSEPTQENLSSLEILWNEAANLYEALNEPKIAAFAHANAIKANLKKVIIQKPTTKTALRRKNWSFRGQNIDYYKYVATRWNEAADLYKKSRYIDIAADAKVEAAKAWVQNNELFPHYSMDNEQNEITCWSEAADLYTEINDTVHAAIARANAARARAKYTGLHLNHPINQMWDEPAMLWDEPAMLWDEAAKLAKDAKDLLEKSAKDKVMANVSSETSIIWQNLYKTISELGKISNPTMQDQQKMINLLNKVAILETKAQDLKKSAKDEKEIKNANDKAAEAAEAWHKAKQTILNVLSKQTLKDWNHVEKLLDDAAELSKGAYDFLKESTKDKEEIKNANDKAAEAWHDAKFMTLRALIEQTEDGWDHAAEFLNTAAELSAKAVDNLYAAKHETVIQAGAPWVKAEAEAKYNAELLRLQSKIMEIRLNLNVTPQDCETVAKYCDKLVELGSAFQNNEKILEDKMAAANAWVGHAKMIVKTADTIENHRNLLNRLNEAVRCATEIYNANSGKAAQYRKNAAQNSYKTATTFRAEAALEEAICMEKTIFNRSTVTTPDDWNALADCWEYAATCAMQANESQRAKAARNNAEKAREHLNDNSSKRSLGFNK